MYLVRPASKCKRYAIIEDLQWRCPGMVKSVSSDAAIVCDVYISETSNTDLKIKIKARECDLLER